MRPFWKRRPPLQTLAGHRIDPPRPTLWAGFWLLVYVGVPVMLVASVLDGVVQLTTGRCTGWWCWF